MQIPAGMRLDRECHGQGRYPPPVSERPAGLVPTDPGQPGTKPRRSLELVQVPANDHKDLLREVLGGLPVAEHGIADRHHGAIIPLVQQP